jgi:hypothetical protein
MDTTLFFYLALAAWRFASLIANEEGPWRIFLKIRRFAAHLCKRFVACEKFGLYELLNCEWCNSVWIGVGLTLLYLWIGNVILYVTLPFALSTVVIVIKYVVQALKAIEQWALREDE